MAFFTRLNRSCFLVNEAELNEEEDVDIFWTSLWSNIFFGCFTLLNSLRENATACWHMKMYLKLWCNRVKAID